MEKEFKVILMHSSVLVINVLSSFQPKHLLRTRIVAFYRSRPEQVYAPMGLQVQRYSLSKKKN